MVEVQGITQHVAMAIAGSSVYGLQSMGTASSPGPSGDYDNSNKVRKSGYNSDLYLDLLLHQNTQNAEVIWHYALMEYYCNIK